MLKFPSFIITFQHQTQFHFRSQISLSGSMEGDCESNSPQTLVLVGKKGNGKSATGNSILGTNFFRSEFSSSGVTIASELQAVKLENGQMLNLIDTPGLFGSSLDTEFIAKEIGNCINLAKDGVHAFLVVFSVRSRFSKAEEYAVRSLETLFGERIYDYMIVVFTGGDLLDDDGETLETYLHDCPESLKETFRRCGDRYVLFDNKTNDETKRMNQVDKLLSLVNMVSRKNGGKPYMNEIVIEVKEQPESFQALREIKWDSEVLGISVLADQMYGDRFNQITEMAETKLKETTLSLERQLAEERVARVKAEENAKAAQKIFEEEKLYIITQIEAVKTGGGKETFKGVWNEIRNCVIL